jgi:alanyl-tRNA synthetase
VATRRRGKGGGARKYAQGDGMPESRLEEALQIAERLLRGKGPA